MSLGPWSRYVLPLILGLPAALAAQDKPAKTTSFVADLGLVNASGNTRITTVNFGDKFVVNTPDKRVIFSQLLGLVYGSTDGTKTAENYRANVRLDYQLVSKIYGYGLAGWDRNTFGGVERRFEETLGLAYKPIENETDHLDFEVGVSLFQQTNTVAANGTFDDNFKAGRFAGLYKHVFNKRTVLSQAAEFIPNFDQSTHWRLNTETSIVAPISTKVGLKLGYVVRYDHLPGLKPAPNPTGERFEKSDRFLTAGITISY